MFSRLSRSLLRSQQLGLLAVLVVLGGALTLAAGSHPDPLTGETVNNFLNAHTLIQMATDASFVRDHGGRRDHRHHLGRHRPLGRRDLRTRGRRDGDDPAGGRPDGPAATLRAWLRHVHRRQPPVRARQRHDGDRTGRAPVHHHARHDVDPPRRRVRDQPRREHPGAVVAHQRCQGTARARRGALSGAAPRDAGGHHRGERVPQAHRDGSPRVRDRRQRRGEPLLRAQREPHQARRVRALGAHGGDRGVPRRGVLRIGHVVGRERLRVVRDRVGGRRWCEPDGRARGARSARRSAPCSSS